MPKRKIRCALPSLVVLAVATLGYQAGAEEALASGDDPLVVFAQRWDGNRDGIYTCGEWKLFARRLFHKADRDRDGAVEASEFRAIKGADPIFAETSLSYFDMNGDERIEPEEFVDRENPLFLRYDGNRDCRVTMPEIMGDGPVRR